MIIILVAIVIGLLPASIAAAKGRNFVLWWIYGAALFIIALPHAIFAKSANTLIDSQQAAAGNVQCPTCAEWIRPEAKICRFCGTKLEPLLALLIIAGLASAIALFPVPTHAQANDIVDMPVRDPLPLFALAYKYAPDGILKDLKGCFTVPGCKTFPQSFPSTRILAAIRDCSKLTSVSNEFQMRDLDAVTRTAIMEAGKTPPSRFAGLIFTAGIGSYDFERQGFPLRWLESLKLYTGAKTCRGEQVRDYYGSFPIDFYLAIPKGTLPSFLHVPQDKARIWIEGTGLELRAVVDVNVTDMSYGTLRIASGISMGGVVTAWVFSGAVVPRSITWRRDGKTLEEVAVTPPPAMPSIQISTPASVLKVNSVRIVVSDVNVRTTPSKSAELATVLKPNAYVTVTEKSPDGLWSRVKVDDTVLGWMLDSALIKNSMTEEQAAAAGEGDMSDVEPPR